MKEIFEQIGNDLAVENPDVTISQMFGMPALKVGKKAFAGLWQDQMVFKLTGASHQKALDLSDSQLFEPMAGHQMKEWVQVSSAHQKDWKKFARSAMEYVSSLKK